VLAALVALVAYVSVTGVDRPEGEAREWRSLEDALGEEASG
jgi:hypothetical protein